MHTQIENLFDHPPAAYTAEHFALFAEFKHALNRGTIRAAIPDPSVAALTYAVLYVGVCFVPVLVLYRRHIFLKV